MILSSAYQPTGTASPPSSKRLIKLSPAASSRAAILSSMTAIDFAHVADYPAGHQQTCACCVVDLGVPFASLIAVQAQQTPALRQSILWANHCAAVATLGSILCLCSMIAPSARLSACCCACSQTLFPDVCRFTQVPGPHRSAPWLCRSQRAAVLCGCSRLHPSLRSTCSCTASTQAHSCFTGTNEKYSLLCGAERRMIT